MVNFAGSPISDLNPIWMACNATFHISSADSGTRTLPADQFFLGYRQVDLKPGEVLQSVVIPYSRPLEFVRVFKQSPRRDDDIAIVNACMRAQLAPVGDGEWRFQEAAIGGCSAAGVVVAAWVALSGVLLRTWPYRLM